MTRQPAVQLSLLSLVAFDAETHLKFDRHQTIHLFHISVADRAVDSTGDMPLMVELNMVRHVGDPDPRDWPLGFVMRFHAEDLGMLRNNIPVTIKAFLHRRNPRVSGSVRIGMTEPAADLLYPCMDPVAEINGLFGAEPSTRINSVKIEHHHEEEDRYPHPNIPSFRVIGLPTLSSAISHHREN